MICPRCEGQRYDVGSCALCGNTGVLDESGEKLAVLAAAEQEERIAEAYRQEGLTGRAARRWASARVVREPAALIKGGERKHKPGTREFMEAAGFRFPVRPCPPRELGQR